MLWGLITFSSVAGRERTRIEAMRDLCPDCDPIQQSRDHRLDRLNALLTDLSQIVQPLKTLTKRVYPGIKYLHASGLTLWVRILMKTSVLQALPVPHHDPTIHHRTHVVIQEAERRGYTIDVLRLFGRYVSNLFRLRFKDQTIYFEGLPTTPIGHSLPIDIDDKSVFKHALEEAGFPVPQGKKFVSITPALRYARELGYPLVVKPVASSLSKHTTTNIGSEEYLLSAITRAQQLCRTYLIEKQIPGHVYRATCVRGRLVACCRREAPSVTSDGKHKIIELIQMKNQDPRRGPAHAKHVTLHKIPLTQGVANELARQNVSLASVPTDGRKIFLHPKVILACGADIYDVTDDIHPENLTLLEAVAKLCVLPLVGLDLICPDISISHRSQPFAVIEANSLPFIDMHHVPVTGKPRNVAGAILDYIEQIS